MNGNDIIDLAIAKIPDGLRGSRFLDKIFTPLELEILNSGRAGVWSIWGMKEAVYKAHHRRFSLPRSFNPKEIEICIAETSENSIMARAEYGGFHYWGYGHFASDHVHCTATCLPQERLYSEIFNISPDQIKTQLKRAISKKLNIGMDDLDIVKDNNLIPHIRAGNLDLKLPFSISHHGKFTAFSFQLINY